MSKNNIFTNLGVLCLYFPLERQCLEYGELSRDFFMKIELI